MRLVLAGGSGYLGSALTQTLADRASEIVVLTRRPRRATGMIRDLAWTPDGNAGPWASAIDGADVVINLAGAGLADKRWTAARKVELVHSRVLSTRSLAAAVHAAAKKPAVLIQGSGAGFYGVSDDRTFDESSPAGHDFLGKLAVQWEAEAGPIADAGVRVVIVRSGVVLSRDGGALSKMTLPFRLFVGGPLGSGRQPFSWIHGDDWLRLVTWAIDTPAASGPYNATAPAPVSNAEFSKALGEAMHRPSWLPVPGVALRIIVGEMATAALLQGQRVVPRRAVDAGFTFRYPTVREALAQIFDTSHDR